MLQLLEVARRTTGIDLPAADHGPAPLAAALDCVDVGIALWDADGRFVTCNRFFHKLHGTVTRDLAPGTSYEDFIRAIAKAKAESQEIDDIEAWVAPRLTEQVSDSASHESQLNGRWVEVRKKALPDGGTLTHIVDISERRQAEDERAQTLVELERSNEELDRFASVASHDLREPLRKIEMFGGMLQRELGDGLSEKASLYLDRMTDAASRMQHLIDDLREFSRVATKEMPMQDVDLMRVVEDVMADIEVQVGESAARIEYADLPTVHANPTQMRQLFQNLICNAIKFAKPDTAPHVVIAARRTAMRAPDATWQISVTDNGVGFDNEYSEKIFELFQRLHGRTEFQGTGIGLAVCRRIAERHNGAITAAGQPDIGATFTVTLPCREPVPAV